VRFYPVRKKPFEVHEGSHLPPQMPLAQAPPTGWRLKKAEARRRWICNRRMAINSSEPLF